VSRERVRKTVRRAPHKQITDVEVLSAILDAALVAHVAVPAPGRLAVVPVGIARDGDRLLIHGSTASQAFRFLATGVETCTTVTLLDGVVVARSQFESSMNYRSAMMFGGYTQLEGEDKESAFAVLAERLMPGMTQARRPSAKESAATSVLALPLTEWSLKVSAKDAPDDATEDLDSEVWGGIVPLHHVWGEPVTAPGIPGSPVVPQALSVWPEGRS
jgi:nitroimidazol reductase NimA-like FMN-containing flavoprotein (pyridoxamine 5'-phosphate oxidase superfamily)